MDITSLAKTILKLSPAVSVALIGPSGMKIANALSAFLDVPLDAIESTLEKDPNAAFQLKQFALENKLTFVSTDETTQEINDAEGSRQRDVKVTSLIGRRDRVMDIIALVVVIGFFGMAILIALTKLDQSDHDVLYTIIGQMAAGFISVLSYFFGSTRKP